MILIRKLLIKINRILSQKTVKWIIVPSILFFLWFFLSLTYSSYKSFTVLQYPHNQDANNNFFGKKLLKDQKLVGSFMAKENNLGIVAVKFGDIPKVDFENEDHFIFRIKEKGQKEWLFVNKYSSGLMKPNSYFPFGFKPILNSKGKVYDFELLSLDGNIYNAPKVRNTNPIYVSKYKFTKAEIFRDKISLLEFAFKKIITFFTGYEILISSSVFLLPFVFYLTWLIIMRRINEVNITLMPFAGGKKILKKILGKEFFAFLVITLIFVDIIFFEDLIIGFMLGFLGFWIFAIYLNKFKSRITFTIAFLIILLGVFSIYFNLIISVDKASTFAFMLILIGFMQDLIEYKKTFISKNLVKKINKIRGANKN